MGLCACVFFVCVSVGSGACVFACLWVCEFVCLGLCVCVFACRWVLLCFMCLCVFMLCVCVFVPVNLYDHVIVLACVWCGMVCIKSKKMDSK